MGLIAGVCTLALIGGLAFRFYPRPRKNWPLDIAQAIDHAASALLLLTGPDGKFNYQVDLRNPTGQTSDYNALRHAGAIYAMSLYEQRTPFKPNRDAIAQALHYMVKEFVRDVKIPSRKLVAQAIYSDATPQADARLGGAGIGLVAAVTASHALGQDKYPGLNQNLAHFILAMQKPEGAFFSNFGPKHPEPTDERPVLYYPGEVLLGLVLFYQDHPDDRILEAALKGLSYLASSRLNMNDLPPDNWTLMATAEILRIPDVRVERARSALIHHAWQVAVSEEDTQNLDPRSPLYGAYTAKGDTTQTSTRLEGILSVLPYFSAEERLLIEASARKAMGFLLRSQLIRGPFPGAFPRFLDVESVMNDRPPTGKIRIDYIQHALSAMLIFEKLGLKAEDARSLGL